jgi:integrase
MLHRRGHVWWTEFYLNGRRHRRSTRQAEKSAAIEFESRLRIELAELAALGRTREMRFGEAMDRYRETVIATKRRKPDGAYRRTSKNDLLRIERLAQWFGRDALLTHVVKPAVVAEFNHELQKTMLPQSANRYLSLLRAILFKAYSWGALAQPPAIRMNREPRPSHRALTEAQEQAIIEGAPERLRDLIIFVLDTGARRAEALNLTWAEVDLARKPRPVVYFTDTKTVLRRGVPVPLRTARMLRARFRRYGARSPLVFAHPATRDLYTYYGTLYARRGEMVTISNFQLLWRDLREQMGIPEFRLHDLRHTYASKLVRRGVPLLDVSRLLGHTSLKMTVRYAYLAVDELDSAVSVLDHPAGQARNHTRRDAKRVTKGRFIS